MDRSPAHGCHPPPCPRISGQMIKLVPRAKDARKQITARMRPGAARVLAAQDVAHDSTFTARPAEFPGHHPSEWSQLSSHR